MHVQSDVDVEYCETCIYRARLNDLSTPKQLWACWLPIFVIRDGTIGLSESNWVIGVVQGRQVVDEVDYYEIAGQSNNLQSEVD